MIITGKCRETRNFYQVLKEGDGDTILYTIYKGTNKFIALNLGDSMIDGFPSDISRFAIGGMDMIKLSDR